jgi:hypothetical protein
MEAVNKKNYIIIGKYCIYKIMIMGEVRYLYVTNSETNEWEFYPDYKVLQLLRKEGLDAEPLLEYFETPKRTTRENGMEIFPKFGEWEQRQEEEWEQTQKEKKLMKKEDKNKKLN